MNKNYILVTSCPDCVGIVATVSNFIAKHNGWITEADYHTDHETGWFFMRQVIKADSLKLKDLDDFKSKFAAVSKKFSMHWKITDTSIKKNVVIFVSKQDHCLADLLYRWRAKEKALHTFSNSFSSSSAFELTSFITVYPFLLSLSHNSLSHAEVFWRLT